MKIKRLFISMLAIAMAMSFTACDDDDDDDDTPPPMEPTLYEKLGGPTLVEDPVNPDEMIEQGKLGLRSVVDTTIVLIPSDTILAPYFETLLMEVNDGNLTGRDALSMRLTNFFSNATGSENIEYNGLDMVTAHDPDLNPRMEFAADDMAFDAFVAAVGASAEMNNVPEELIVEVADLLETLREPVVQE
jgi:hypothetical protein